jgi:hypothetical protein
MSSAPVIAGTSAIAVAPAMETAVAVADPEPVEGDPFGGDRAPQALSLPKIQTATLTVMEQSGQKIVAHWLEMGEWKVEGSEVVVGVGAKQSMIDAALKGEAQRQLNEAASGVSGQAVRVRLIAGTGSNGNGGGVLVARPVGDGSDARTRALNDPVVKRMKEKFGTEIRTVVDQRKRY